MKKQKGIVLVYTGTGKGKTTAALGLALRAIGHGARVFMVQFKKSDSGTGEIKTIEKYLPDFVTVQSGKNKMREDGTLTEDDISITRAGFLKGKEAVLSGEYDLVIFDEINIVMDRGLLPADEVIEMLSKKPAHVDIVLTGRNAPVEITNFADLVSEVKEIKHPYSTGTRARRGMEF